MPGSEGPYVKRHCHIILFWPNVFINSGLEQSPVLFSFKVFTSRVLFFSDLAAQFFSFLLQIGQPSCPLLLSRGWPTAAVAALFTEQHVHRWNIFHTRWAKCFMDLAQSSPLDSVMRSH